MENLNRKSGSYPVLLLTSLATIIGAGSTLGTISEIYKVGLIFVIPSLGYVLGSFIFGKFIALKFDERFKNMISVGDIISYFYGNNASTISAIIGFLYCTGIVGIQITAFGHIFNSLCGIDYNISVLIGGIVTVFYSCIGGIRSVVITDVIQFSLLIVVFPLLASIFMNESGGILHVLEKVEPSKLVIFDRPDIWVYIILFFALSLPMHHLNPTLIQRYLMAKSPFHIRRIMYTYGFLKVSLVIILAFISLSTLVIYPNLPPEKILNISIINLLPTVLKGLTLSGIFAVIMSTADSNINSAGILLSHNFLFKLFPNYNELRLMKLTSFLSGVIGVGIALLKLNIIRSIMDLELIWGLSIGIPIMIGVLKIKILPQFFWFCSLMTSLSMVLYYLSGCTISMVTLSSTFLIFSVVASYQYKQNKHVIKKAFHNLFLKFKNKRQKNLHTKTSSLFSKLLILLDKKLDKNEANFRVYGVFCCLNYIVPCFMWNYHKINNINTIITLRFVAGIICVFLLLRDYWPQKILKYFSIYWYFALFLTLPFFTTFMAINNFNSTFWFINISLSIFLLSMLVDWLSFVIISLSGILGGIFAYSFLIKIPSHTLNFETIYNGFYIIIFSTIIAFTFGRKREGLADIKFSTAANMAGILSHEIKASLAKLAIITTNIKKNIGSNLNKDNLEKFIPRLDVTIKDASSLVDDILIKLKKETNNVELEILSIRAEIQSILSDVNLTDEEKAKIKVENNNDFRFLGNRILFKHLIYNLLKNSLYYTQHKSDADILLSIKSSSENNILLFKDTGDGIDENDLDHIFISFYSKRPNGTGFGLFFCKQTMSLFGGGITCSSKNMNIQSFVFRFL